jgi:hypothetical protein
MICVKPALAHGLELGLKRPGQRDGVHPEIVNVAFAVVAHDRAVLFRPPLSWTSSNITPPM